MQLNFAIAIVIEKLYRNIKRNPRSFIWNGIKENTAVDVLNSLFHKKHAHSGFAVPFFLNGIDVKSFSIIINGDAQKSRAVGKLYNNMSRIGIFDCVIDGFLR